MRLFPPTVARAIALALDARDEMATGPLYADVITRRHSAILPPLRAVRRRFGRTLARLEKRGRITSRRVGPVTVYRRGHEMTPDRLAYRALGLFIAGVVIVVYTLFKVATAVPFEGGMP